MQPFAEGAAQVRADLLRQAAAEAPPSRPSGRRRAARPGGRRLRPAVRTLSRSPPAQPGVCRPTPRWNRCPRTKAARCSPRGRSRTGRAGRRPGVRGLHRVRRSGSPGRGPSRCRRGCAGPLLEHGPDGADAVVDALLEVHEGVGAPEQGADLLAAHHVAGPAGQEHQQLQGLWRQPYPDAGPSELPADEGRGRRVRSASRLAREGLGATAPGPIK